ncbi:unnamed protein product [Strongylus vulgaris]|uniref:Uncharacterized protein n=1 Tax=Strongylus vulgaris TaxID=40348 RepID=A0A3P7JXD6_STRVU|nr:unnamed protein product [Strongylus vulgaris]
MGWQNVNYVTAAQKHQNGQGERRLRETRAVTQRVSSRWFVAQQALREANDKRRIADAPIRAVDIDRVYV